MKRISLITSLAIALSFSATVIPSAQNLPVVAVNDSLIHSGGSQRLISSLGPSIVSVSGRQLIVRKRNGDGTLAPPTPYISRGVNWSPASPQTIDDINVRRQEFQPAAPTDIPLMRDMNVNTVRTYMDPPLDASGMSVLDQLYSNGIMVVMTVDNGNGRRDINRVQQAVTFYKDHPAILMWSLDNEWNIHPSIPICQIADQIQQEAALIKTLDTNHPVATSYGDIDINEPGAHLADTQNYVNNKCPSVDVWSLNIFRGNTFGTLFDQWASMTTKPMMIGEFGTDAFRLYGLGNQPPGIEDGTMQAQWDLSQWNHLFKNLSANDPAKVALGAFVFEWNDEWWKVPPTNSQDPGGCGPPDCPNHPDAFANEEYFGIVNIDRQPRAIYATLTAAFHPAYQPQTLTYRATSRGFTAQEYPSQNGVARLFKEGAPFYQPTGGAGGGRGFNIAAINPCTGVLIQPAQTYDTWGSTHMGDGSKFCEISSFLDSLPTGTLVMMAVADEAGLNNFDVCTLQGHSCIGPFLQKLTVEYHSTMISQYCYRNSWAMISVKGEAAARGEQLSSAGEASAQTTLPILTSVSPTSQVFPAGGGSNSIALTVPSGCAWTASRGSNDTWIMVTTGSGTGSGTVNYSVDANTGATLRAGTISVAGQTFVVSQAGTPTNVQVTVQTNPSGLSFTVDGSTFTTAQTLNWTSASCHTISTTTPQNGAGGTQYLWSNWSDGGAISHEVAPAGNATYTANFVASPPPIRTLTVASSNPPSGVSITVSPLDNNGQGNGVTQFTRLYNDTAVVSLTAPATAGGNNFQKWQRDGVDVSTSTTTNVEMDANHTMTAVFSSSNKGTIGLYNPATSFFYLSNSNSSAPADVKFGYGPAGAGWIPVAGDWNGDGVDTIGLYNPATSTFFLSNSNSSAPASLVFTYGPAGAGWIPIGGDWNGDGIDTIGLYNGATSTFFLSNSNASAPASLVFTYGPAGAGWIPIAGDWNGDGIDTIGLYDPGTSTFFLSNSNSSAPAGLVFGYGPAGAGWRPVTGDWNGDGTDTIGLFNPTTSTFFLRNTNSSAPADLVFSYGPAGAGWTPIVGDWDGL